MSNLDQQGLYHHWKLISSSKQLDFRAYSLCEIIARYLSKDKSVIDVGCGTGIQSNYLAEFGFSVVGIDNSSKMIKIANQHHSKIKKLSFKKLSLFSIGKLNKNIDQVLLLDVLEHIENDAEAVKVLTSALNPGSKLVVSVPAHQFLFGNKDKRIGHYRRYSLNNIVNMIESNGLTIEKKQYWNFLGFLIVLLSQSLFRQSPSESYRYSKSPISKFIQKLLLIWFLKIENVFSFPIGLSCLVVAKKH